MARQASADDGATAETGKRGTGVVCGYGRSDRQESSPRVGGSKARRRGGAATVVGTTMGSRRKKSSLPRRETGENREYEGPERAVV